METEGQNFLASGVTSHVSACTTELTSSWELINLLAKEEHSPPLQCSTCRGTGLRKLLPLAKQKNTGFKKKRGHRTFFASFCLLFFGSLDPRARSYSEFCIPLSLFFSKNCSVRKSPEVLITQIDVAEAYFVKNWKE